MTDNQKDKAYALLGEGLSTAEVARRTRLSVPTVAALRANLTMRNQPKFFEVSGTWVIEATSREDALNSIHSRRMRGVRVISNDVSASRISNSQASELGYSAS